jgi:photosystem I P700 chlorophyll a apoprotein A1
MNITTHKGPFTGEGHTGLYEILTTSWHAQLAVNLALFGSLSIIVAHHQYAMPPYPYLATSCLDWWLLYCRSCSACSHFYGS